jgi:hypothetical protein
LFEISPPDTKFSKYAQSLDRIFKSNSLENLQQNLRSPKQVKVFHFFESFGKAGRDAEQKKMIEKRFTYFLIFRLELKSFLNVGANIMNTMSTYSKNGGQKSKANMIF